MFLFLNKIAPDIQTQGWSNKIVYLAFWCWVLIVIFPLSLTLYRWIEKPGMRAGELCIRLLTGANKKPAAATTEPKGPEGIKVQEPVGTAPTGSAL